MKRSILVLASVSMCFFQSYSSQAQISGALDRHYNNSKNYESTTPSGVYRSQTRDIVTLGSFSQRFPQTDTQIASVKLPKISAGCGGIDAFAGGFSFINGDQIRDLFRNIIQNAKGYAFALAISVFSPLIDNIREQMQSITQRVNGLNINSCELATASVNSLFDQVSTAVGKDCEAIATAFGAEEDALAARVACGQGNRVEDLFSPGGSLGGIFTGPNDSFGGGTDTEEVVMASIAPRNISWDATSRNAFYKDDIEMREFFMSLTGSQIISIGPNGVPEFTLLTPISTDMGVFDIILNGGTMKIHQCVETERCLAVQPFGKDVTLTAEDSFVSNVQETLISIYDKHADLNDDDLTPAEYAFINSTGIPVVRASLVFSQSMSKPAGRELVLNYADIVAHDLATTFLQDMIKEVQAGISSIVGTDKSDLNDWVDSMRSLQRDLGERQTKLDARVSAVKDLVDLIETHNGPIAARIVQQMTSIADSGAQ